MIDYIIPLPEGTISGGKPADGLMACSNGPELCGEVAVVRIMKTGEIAAYCDGKVTVRKCGARQFSGSKRSFPKRDKETALAQAFDLGLSDAPQEYIDLFESSWGVKLNNSQSEAKNHEANTPENPEITFKTVTADPGTTPDIPADKSAENGDNSGISGSTDEDVYNALYGG